MGNKGFKIKIVNNNQKRDKSAVGDPLPQPVSSTETF